MKEEPPKPALPHVDAAMLADILSFTSVEFVVESIEEFLVAAEDGLDEIAAAIAQEERRAIERCAHRLRGSCGVTGAVRLAERCGRLEAGAREASFADLAELLSCARQELSFVKRDLGSERERLLSGAAGGAG